MIDIIDQAQSQIAIDIIDVGGKPYEATNPITAEKVAEYVGNYNTAVEASRNVIARSNELLQQADTWKTLLQRIHDTYPTLITDDMKSILS